MRSLLKTPGRRPDVSSRAIRMPRPGGTTKSEKISRARSIFSNLASFNSDRLLNAVKRR